jgi:hypothetical protein
MRAASTLVSRTVHRVNSCALTWRDSPRFGRLVRSRLTVVSYVGRRSGRTFSTPVAYRRTADGVVITVAIPDRKNWWRNFLDGGGPITVQLDGMDRTGHAVAHRDVAAGSRWGARRTVSVVVRFDTE